MYDTFFNTTAHTQTHTAPSDPGSYPELPCCDSCERSNVVPSPSTSLLSNFPSSLVFFLFLPLFFPSFITPFTVSVFLLGHSICMHNFITEIKMKIQNKLTIFKLSVFTRVDFTSFRTSQSQVLMQVTAN